MHMQIFLKAKIFMFSFQAMVLFFPQRYLLCFLMSYSFSFKTPTYLKCFLYESIFYLTEVKILVPIKNAMCF